MPSITPTSILVLLASSLLAFGATAATFVKPSSVDPRIAHFDDDHVVIGDAPAQAPLVVFLPGTGGKPANAMALLEVVAAQGYRVIGLEYDDEPAVAQVCPRDPDPDCSARFRRMRTTGEGPAPVSNAPEESIVARLSGLLAALARLDPSAGWAGYLMADGTPAWNRIVVSGLSQGAGMAAYIAKEHAVRRVVLFSSPWDFTGAGRRPAPWLSAPSATPAQRWWAERHVRENTTAALAAAYAALDIPPGHILLFDRDLRGRSPSDNPYHGSTIRDPGYADDWRRMFSRAGDDE